MSPPPKPASRSRNQRKIAGYVLPGLIVAVVGMAARVAEQKFGAPPWLLPVALTVTLLVIARLIYMWWNAFDEVAKDAHRDSWLWGGSAGLGVSVILLVGVGNYAEALHLADLDPMLLFISGAGSVFLPLMIGYLIWWAAWWMKRR